MYFKYFCSPTKIQLPKVVNKKTNTKYDKINDTKISNKNCKLTSYNENDHNFKVLNNGKLSSVSISYLLNN